MSAIFKAHLEKFITPDDEHYTGILSFFEFKKIKKKENLLIEGQVCRYNYFVQKGCLRKFFINEKGVEQTTEFAIENWWISDNISYEHHTASSFFIQAVEPTELMTINATSQEKLLEQYPEMERYFRFIYQRAYAASQMRIKYLYSFSKEEFYHQMLEKHPEFVQRIPQYLLASFLGFTPEYLSEIRAKRIS